ncbi:hypothetical protein [Siphonobacter sp. BAB-5405]|uniref:hypothetical protein n=1 Tax=Siphonobacter sp. BAB-5405 TaxID=1864825 RepID=UPI0011AEE34D|nr:hypothetical protein [Siphonobacter sp. BAB-5405]
MQTILLSLFFSLAPAKTDSVYICNSSRAYAYHAYFCHGLNRCTHGVSKVSRAEAIRMRKTACKICY